MSKGGIVNLDGVEYRGMTEIQPRAVSDFVVCEVIEVEMETAGGIALTRGDGQPYNVMYIVHSIGPELKINEKSEQLKVGDRIMPIAPEAMTLPGSKKLWSIFHESQIKAVIEEAK